VCPINHWTGIIRSEIIISLLISIYTTPAERFVQKEVLPEGSCVPRLFCYWKEVEMKLFGPKKCTGELPPHTPEQALGKNPGAL
jgi:hypothetical protein